MALNPFLVTALVAALAIAAVAEILIAYQKYQMRKQFMRELDGVTSTHVPASSSSPSLNSREKKGQQEEEKREERESKAGSNRRDA